MWIKSLKKSRLKYIYDVENVIGPQAHSNTEGKGGGGALHQQLLPQLCGQFLPRKQQFFWVSFFG